MDKNIIEKILNAALDELYEKDQKLIFNEQFEGNRTHRHQGADIHRPGQETLADALLIEALRQLIAQQR